MGGIMDTRNDEWIRTGIALVDHQHEEYFRRLDILLAILGNSELNAHELRKSFDYFRSFAVVHFDTEELLMKISVYPQTEEHMKMHEFFGETIERLVQEMNTGGDIHYVAGELKVFVSGWLQDHIETHDMKLTSFLKDKISAGIANP